MKSDEMRKILQGIIEVIDLYPNKEISYILNDIKRLKEKADKPKDDKKTNKKTKVSKVTDVEQKILIDQLFDNIDSLKYQS